MRYFTYNVGAQLVRELEITGAVDHIVHDGRDIIHLKLVTGESLMISLIDSYIPLYEIKHILKANTEANHYTLFMLWSDVLLPDHGTSYELEDWHHGLLALYEKQIYAYKVYLERLFIFPVYFDHQPYRSKRRVRYGDPIDVGTVYCRMVETTVDDLHGRWWVAGFGGDPSVYERRYEGSYEPISGTLQESYRLLEIEPGADLGKIKKAYRDLARQYHPDTNAGKSEATERMQALNRAYDLILKSLEQQRKGRRSS
jgi:hypothetical protein